MNAGIQKNLTSRLAGWFGVGARVGAFLSRLPLRYANRQRKLAANETGTLQQSSDWFTPIPSRAAEFVDQFGF